MNESFDLIGRRTGAGGALARRLRQGFELVLLWDERARQRQRLLAMDDRRLKDLGLSRAEAALEAAKPFWRP